MNNPNSAPQKKLGNFCAEYSLVPLAEIAARLETVQDAVRTHLATGQCPTSLAAVSAHVAAARRALDEVQTADAGKAPTYDSEISF